MTADAGKGGGREFRLEGAGLAAVAAVLLLGLAAAFFGGRWYERRWGAGPQAGAAVAADPLAHVEEPGAPAEAAEGMNYFDTLQGEGKAAEPQREARPRTAAETAPATPEPKQEAAAARHFVQVFAGRSRASAEELVDKLQQQGYTARLSSDDRGGERLYKVQVGYALEDEARAAVEELRSKGFPSAFYVNAG